MTEREQPTTTETKAARLAELEAAKAKRKEAQATARLDLDLERAELEAKCEDELGEQGKKWMLYDATHLGCGLFVVKLGPAVHYTKYVESKLTSVDKFDFVAPNVVHPARETFLRLVGERPAIMVELGNRLASLYGTNIRYEEGK